MRSFIRKVIYISALTFCIQFIIGELLLKHRDKLLEETYFPIKRWKNFYDQPKNSLNMIFLGSSHCYRSLIPEVFDSALNVNSFNMGSSSQSISTSYYVLKEVLNTQSPSIIIFEIFHSTLTADNSYIDVLHNYPQMHSTIKYQMLSTLNKKDAFELMAFPLKTVAINKDQLLLIKKQYPDTTNSTYSIYHNKGYVATFAKKGFKFNLKKQNSNIKLPKINPRQVNYLKKIIQLCRSKQIQLVIVTQPIHPSYWAQIGTPNLYNKLDSLLKQEKIPYYNLNKLSPIPDSLFYDTGHLLNTGSQIFSKNVADILVKQQNLRY